MDTLYLYHPELVESLSRHGQQFGAVGNYETDGCKIGLKNALKQTLYVLASQDHFRRYLIYITDRNPDERALEKVLYLNHKDGFDCNFILIGIGDQYDKEIFARIDALALEKYNCTMWPVHLDSPLELTPELFKEEKLDEPTESA